MTDVTELCCENCRFWRHPTRKGDDDDAGHCRRRAPIAARADDYLDDIAVAIKLLLWWTMREWSDEETAEKQLKDFHIGDIEQVFHFTQWPLTEPYDWCGEWEARLNQEQQAAAA
jgi:GAF domain-containing protein